MYVIVTPPFLSVCHFTFDPQSTGQSSTSQRSLVDLDPTARLSAKRTWPPLLCPQVRRPHVTVVEVAVCHPVHYINRFGRRPRASLGARLDVNAGRHVMMYTLLPPLLTPGTLVEPGALPRGLRLPKYHLRTFLLYFFPV